MSDATLNATASSTEATHAKKSALRLKVEQKIEALREFYQVLRWSWIVVSNKPTIYMAIGVYAMLATVSNVVIRFIFMNINDYSVSTLEFPLQMMSLASFFYVGTYFAPMIYEVMKHSEKKRVAEAMARRDAWEAKQASQNAANGTYSI